MAGRKLNQYREGLTSCQIADGMNAVAENARTLFSDARHLFEKGSYPTALSLATLSIEESGKCSILRGIALAQDQKQRHALWREFRSHKSKNRMWPMLDMALAGARKLSDFRSMFDSNSDHPYLLDNLKQLGFYTDCLGKSHWSKPNEVIDSKLADLILRSAEILLPKRKVTSQEIELWIKHMQPAWNQSHEVKETALIAWYQEMSVEGLHPDSPDDMKKFIFEGLIPDQDSSN